MDDAAIREFVSKDYGRIVNAVAFVAGSVEVAEDLVQEALARAWASSARGESIESLPNWVAAVALNLSRSRWRRVLVERRHASRVSVRDASPGPNPDRVDVMRALASLPRRQREVAVLRYLLGLSTREVAAVLQVGEGTVKNSLSKARAALAVRLEIDDAEVVNDVPDR